MSIGHGSTSRAPLTRVNQACKPMGHVAPGRFQAHWSLVMLEGSKIKVLRNASGYSGTLLEVGENCFQLSEVTRFCAKRIFLNFAVFHFFL